MWLAHKSHITVMGKAQHSEHLLKDTYLHAIVYLSRKTGFRFQLVTKTFSFLTLGSLRRGGFGKEGAGFWAPSNLLTC